MVVESGFDKDTIDEAGIEKARGRGGCSFSTLRAEALSLYLRITPYNSLSPLSPLSPSLPLSPLSLSLSLSLCLSRSRPRVRLYLYEPSPQQIRAA